MPTGTAISGASCVNSTCWPSGERYSKLHWNRCATARIRTSVAETLSIELRVCHDRTNRIRTMTVGMTVQMTSSRLLPWVWTGSPVSVGLRR